MAQMHILLTILKILLLWIFVPLLLGTVFVVAPCYTLGEFFHQERLWCGYKGGPPYMGTQFVAGLVAGLAIGLLVSWKTHWISRRRKPA